MLYYTLLHLEMSSNICLFCHIAYRSTASIKWIPLGYITRAAFTEIASPTYCTKHGAIRHNPLEIKLPEDISAWYRSFQFGILTPSHFIEKATISVKSEIIIFQVGNMASRRFFTKGNKRFNFKYSNLSLLSTLIISIFIHILHISTIKCPFDQHTKYVSSFHFHFSV